MIASERERITNTRTPARGRFVLSALRSLPRVGVRPFVGEMQMGKRSQVNPGDRYGRLTIIQEIETRTYPSGTRKRWFSCKCDCGEMTASSISNLKNGHVSSCGCLQRESRCVATRTHGKRHTKEYKTWATMKQRCSNPRNHKYPIYGGRGITVCDRWKDSFENFIDDMGECPQGCSIDRIDNDSGYFKENCRWSDATEQQRNKSTNVVLTFQGKSMCIAAWAEEKGMKTSTLWARLQRGWDIKEALETKVGTKRTSK